jgi:alkanesulfonate monooxygenase SsuD/methylene tetrahydromethanopterin reductase-like flavin-dependent oxidoreductase (luciferase family)
VVQIGLTLPTNLPGVDGQTVLEWARGAEAAGFATVGMGERIGYEGYDWAVALSAAAAVTTRVQLLSSIVILPLRSVGLAAKESLSVHRLSGGRLSFGVGLGGHDREDYALTDAAWDGRVARFEQQLVDLRPAWAGEPLVEGYRPIGPRPGPEGPPELIVGGFAPAAVRRAAHYADGINVHDIAGDVGAAKAEFDIMLDAWQEYGRSGRPRLMAGFFYSLGPQAEEQLKDYFDDYYEYGGPAIDAMIAGVNTYSVAAIRDKMAQFEAIGCDLVILTPVTGSLDQLARVSEIMA